jgi:hypothetical protein
VTAFSSLHARPALLLLLLLLLHSVMPGQLGIIPTDSLPAVVCDLNNKAAALKLFNVMELAPKKQLSILVGGFNDISTYTTGVHSWRGTIGDNRGQTGGAGSGRGGGRGFTTCCMPYQLEPP